MVTDPIAFFNTLLRVLNPSNLVSFHRWMVQQGREIWIRFKSWYWGLNCDIHEKFVRTLVPIVPIIDEEINAREALDALERRVDTIALEYKFEEVIEIDYNEKNEEFNQDLYDQGDDERADINVVMIYPTNPITGARTHVDVCTNPLQSEQDDVLEEEVTEAIAMGLAIVPFEETADTACKRIENITIPTKLVMRKKEARKQTHKIIEGHINDAIRAVEVQVRTKHGLVPSNELNEQALRMTALEICKSYNMNDMDTALIVNKAAYMAMIPDQQQMDAIRIIYNSETQSRLNTIEALRMSAEYSAFNMSPSC
jgi:hypothetical protein